MKKNESATENSMMERSFNIGWKMGENVSTHNSSYQKEYNRRLQNGRIAKRISNPKRDKVIQMSLKESLFMIKSSSQEKIRSQERKKFSYTSFSGWRVEKTPTITATQEDYELKLQNERMGKRIINMQPMIRSFHSPNFSRPKKQKSKINQGVKAFFSFNNFLKVSEKQNVHNCQLKPYGFGSTVISLRNIRIELNPPLKEEDFLYFQLLVRNTNNKLYITQLINYKTILSQDLKFSVRINKLGNSVPLKIWKVQGVENIELGIIDLQLCQYTEQKDKFHDGSFGSVEDFQQGISVLQNDQGKTKLLIKKYINTKFRKSKTEECHGRISLQYLIYKKKFT